MFVVLTTGVLLKELLLPLKALLNTVDDETVLISVEKLVEIEEDASTVLLSVASLVGVSSTVGQIPMVYMGPLNLRLHAELLLEDISTPVYQGHHSQQERKRSALCTGEDIPWRYTASS